MEPRPLRANRCGMLRLNFCFSRQFSEQEIHDLHITVHNDFSYSNFGRLSWRKQDQVAQLQLGNP